MVVGHIQIDSMLPKTFFGLLVDIDSRLDSNHLPCTCVRFIENNRAKYPWWAWLNKIENGGLKSATSKATPIKCPVSGWVVSSTVMRASGLLILLWMGVACETKLRNRRRVFNLNNIYFPSKATFKWILVPRWYSATFYRCLYSKLESRQMNGQETWRGLVESI